MSPAIGGIVVGYEVCRQLDIETIFAERLDKQLKLRRGFKLTENLNVLIDEDVITNGKSAIECSELIEASKSKLIGYACIIDRSNNKSLIKDKIVSQIKLKIDTYTDTELPNDLEKIQPTKPGSRNL